MKIVNSRYLWSGGVAILIFGFARLSAFAGACAVSDGSWFDSGDGCMLAYVYNQTDDQRLVVIDEKNRRRYEAPLDNSRMAPFWEGGKVYVLAHSGSLQGFRIGADGLIAEKTENISKEVVRMEEYSRSQHRLYLICSHWDDQRIIHYELLAIDFPARKTLWRKSIGSLGLLMIMDRYVCVTERGCVEVFDSGTGEKAGSIEVAKGETSADANAKQ